MNSLFSFHRIKLLAIRYLTEHWRREVISLSAFFIAFAFIPRLISGPSENVSPILFGAILLLGGARFTARIFHEIHHPSGGMHYVHIPASRWEKFLFNGVLSLLCYPVACLLLYYGGTLFGNLLEFVMPSFLNYRVIELSSLLPKQNIEEFVIQLLLYHAIFFLGSLFFKNHPTTKTFLSIILFGFAISLVEIFLAKIIWGGIDSSPDSIEVKVVFFTQMIQNSTLASFINYLITTIVLLFFWIVSYLKFREKQV